MAPNANGSQHPENAPWFLSPTLASGDDGPGDGSGVLPTDHRSTAMRVRDPNTGRFAHAPSPAPERPAPDGWTFAIGVFALVAAVLFGMVLGYHLAPSCAG